MFEAGYTTSGNTRVLLLITQRILRFTEGWSNYPLTQRYLMRLIKMRNLIRRGRRKACSFARRQESDSQMAGMSKAGCMYITGIQETRRSLEEEIIQSLRLLRHTTVLIRFFIPLLACSS